MCKNGYHTHRCITHDKRSVGILLFVRTAGTNKASRHSSGVCVQTDEVQYTVIYCVFDQTNVLGYTVLCKVCFQIDEVQYRVLYFVCVQANVLEETVTCKVCFQTDDLHHTNLCYVCFQNEEVQ